MLLITVSYSVFPTDEEVLGAPCCLPPPSRVRTPVGVHTGQQPPALGPILLMWFLSGTDIFCMLGKVQNSNVKIKL